MQKQQNMLIMLQTRSLQSKLVLSGADSPQGVLQLLTHRHLKPVLHGPNTSCIRGRRQQ